MTGRNDHCNKTRTSVVMNLLFRVIDIKQSTKSLPIKSCNAYPWMYEFYMNLSVFLQLIQRRLNYFVAAINSFSFLYNVACLLKSVKGRRPWNFYPRKESLRYGNYVETTFLFFDFLVFEYYFRKKIDINWKLL